MTASTSLLPTTLDLYAIHEALLTAGYTRVRTEPAYAEDPNWVYQGDDAFTYWSITSPEHGLSMDPNVRTVQEEVTLNTLNHLIATTGDQHLHCGPRNDRERALIETLNATLIRTAAL